MRSTRKEEGVMMRFPRGLAYFFLFAGMMSCTTTPGDLAAKYTKRGDEYVQKGKFPEAVIEYRNAVKATPQDAALRWKLARTALEAKDIRTAYTELQKTVELDPAHHEALGKLGEIYVAMGETGQASLIADNLVVTLPKNPQGYILKSALAVRSGKMDEAIAQARKAVELDPKNAKPILTVGNLYLLKRDPGTAR